jgi:uncharacterized Fe-S center protein
MVSDNFLYYFSIIKGLPMSKVFFSPDPSKSADVFKAAGLDALISPGKEVALKIHFGEPGNTAYLKPGQVKPVADAITSLGGKPFYIDCNTLYDGARKTTAGHLMVAENHGFSEMSAGARAVVPEEEDFETVEINQKHYKKVFIGGPAARCEIMITLTHFKGHEVAGFGGALKNLGMGLGTRRGKLRMHQDCEHCREVKTCKKNQTIEACWIGSPRLTQEKIVEYAFGALAGKKAGHVSYLTAISPACDCYGFNAPPVVPDIGVLASADPVALDQASVDLVNNAGGRDVFRGIYPKVDWAFQLDYAEAIGMGKRRYELVPL